MSDAERSLAQLKKELRELEEVTARELTSCEASLKHWQGETQTNKRQLDEYEYQRFSLEQRMIELNMNTIDRTSLLNEAAFSPQVVIPTSHKASFEFPGENILRAAGIEASGKPSLSREATLAPGAKLSAEEGCNLEEMQLQVKKNGRFITRSDKITTKPGTQNCWQQEKRYSDIESKTNNGKAKQASTTSTLSQKSKVGQQKFTTSLRDVPLNIATCSPKHYQLTSKPKLEDNQNSRSSNNRANHSENRKLVGRLKLNCVQSWSNYNSQSDMALTEENDNRNMPRLKSPQALSSKNDSLALNEMFLSPKHLKQPSDAEPRDTASFQPSKDLQKSSTSSLGAPFDFAFNSKLNNSGKKATSASNRESLLTQIKNNAEGLMVENGAPQVVKSRSVKDLASAAEFKDQGSSSKKPSPHGSNQKVRHLTETRLQPIQSLGLKSRSGSVKSIGVEEQQRVGEAHERDLDLLSSRDIFIGGCFGNAGFKMEAQDRRSRWGEHCAEVLDVNGDYKRSNSVEIAASKKAASRGKIGSSHSPRHQVVEAKKQRPVVNEGITNDCVSYKHKAPSSNQHETEEHLMSSTLRSKNIGSGLGSGNTSILNTQALKYSTRNPGVFTSISSGVVVSSVNELPFTREDERATAVSLFQQQQIVITFAFTLLIQLYDRLLLCSMVATCTRSSGTTSP